MDAGCACRPALPPSGRRFVVPCHCSHGEDAPTARPQYPPAHMHASAQRVIDAAARGGVAIAVQEFPDGTRTADDAARAVGVSVGQIVKSLVFSVDGEIVVALVSGSNRLSEPALAAATGEPSRAVGRVDTTRSRPRPASPSAACPHSVTPAPSPPSSTAIFSTTTRSGRPRVHHGTCSPISPNDLVALSGATIADLRDDG